MSVKIKKLTPPQVQAVRDALPACVTAGVIVTTNSIVEFRDGAVKTFGNITTDKVRALLQRKLSEQHSTQLVKVYNKLATRPDLVEES